MKPLLYFMIFASKIIENTLATLRLIVVANGKKLIGAVLQFAVALVWVLVTGVVVTNIQKDPFKIVVFALGSFAGSYLGSILEEKIALGHYLFTVIVEYEYGKQITDELRKQQFAVTSMKAIGKDNQKYVLMILSKRKKRKQISNIIQKVDANAMIVTEKATPVCGGYHYDF